MAEVYVFDIGGTLMEYRGMPNSWAAYYEPCFRYADRKLGIELPEEGIEQAVQILRSYNPRIHYREEDYAPELIFGEIVAAWKKSVDVQALITAFFEGMKLDAVIYEDSKSILEELKRNGKIIAAFTDVAVGMPDSLHKKYFRDLLPYFDMYVSSVSCGFRKPNPKGLQEIAERYQVPSDQILFIGDEKKDIETAKRFGCKAVLIDRRGTGSWYGQDFSIRDLKEVPIIIWSKIRGGTNER